MCQMALASLAQTVIKLDLIATGTTDLSQSQLYIIQ